ncbi:archaea-specific SMC-related protein [Halobium salinum]|uniref:Archaea-specific SMC-related protein n=1 Tax=Halobium salinum TaxID=1364940 RepID=A0ABD5PAT5_9EURY|nr:archaea-specific SMC-related protein [Halobium salinum]
MSTDRPSAGGIEISARKIGGIDDTTVSLTPGVTVLAGRNATNRTSFLQSIMAAVGSENASLKGDAEEGSVELRLDGERYTRRLRRTPDGVAFDGDPYLDDPELADLFAFLLESNEARRGVAREENLRELIMRPVDTSEINAEIELLRAERRSVDERLEEIEAERDRLPALERRRSDVETRLEEKRAELAEVEAAIERSDAAGSQERAEAVEESLDALNERRSALKRVQEHVETERDSLETARAELNRRRTELESLPDAPDDRIDALDREISELRERRRRCDAVVNKLQTLVQFNEDALAGDDELADLLAEDEPASDGGTVTDQLVGESNTVCWTCGSEVDRSRIESFLDRLRALAREKRRDRSDIDDQLSAATDERRELKEQRERRENLESRVDALESEVEEREAALERHEAEVEELETAIGELEDEVGELDADDHDETLERHREANSLQFDIGRLTGQLAEVKEELEELEALDAEADRLGERRGEIAEELEELRTRIERLEREAIDGFNDHMDDILSILGYGNIDRIWIERREEEAREGRRTVDRTRFDLHVVRTSDDGTAYEDTIRHLSESEREVTGLVFALAGYLAHEVYETVPFMLLDSLEAIDSARIAALVEYFEDYAPNIVVALLPEDAQALDDDYSRITEI